MLPIGRFAKLANVSARTLRFYESLGLIESTGRGENNYRLYDRQWLDQVARIRELQSLGFSLEEIKEILKISAPEFLANLTQKLKEVENDLVSLQERREKILKLLSVSRKIESGEFINDTERKEYMEAVHAEIISRLEKKNVSLTPAHLAYLKRDLDFSTPEQIEFVEAIKKCMRFAQERKFNLGHLRGSSSSSLVLHALDINRKDPIGLDLYPERFVNFPNVHIDVGFEGGQEFVDYCQDVSRNLKYGEIQVFKMPLLDIIENTQARLPKRINMDDIHEDSETVLSPIRAGDLERIFNFHFSPDALVSRYEDSLPEYRGIEKIKMYVQSQEIHSFRDVQNIISLWRPEDSVRLERLERYRLAKKTPYRYVGLADEMQETLKENFGMIIYHEDMIRILASATGWSNEKCILFRRFHLHPNRRGDLNSAEYQEFLKVAPPAIVHIFNNENPHTFCQPHTKSFSQFTKATAILKSLHKDIYYEEIEKWEQKNGFRWDDIGIRIKGVSLLQS